MLNLQKIREKKGVSINGLSKISGVNASYISALERGEKQNPTVTTLKKLANALKVTIDELVKEGDDKELEESGLSSPFSSVEEAIEFIKKPGIATYGGYDIDKMSDDEIIAFANELLNQLKLLGYKYKN